MKIHSLKTWPKFFYAITNDDKCFEYRRDDRDFQVGDVLLLREWDDNQYTGSIAVRHITHILRNAEHIGLPKDYCVIGFKPATLRELRAAEKYITD